MSNLSQLFKENGKSIIFKLPDNSNKHELEFIKKRIIECGGQVTNIASKADIILQDQENKIALSNSYSVKFIIDSYFWGELQNKDNYKIISKYNISTNTLFDEIKYNKTSSRNSVRIPFTKEDDTILISYINETKLPTSGNTLYKDIEKKHPHHTWQSWRNRWVRILEPILKGNSKKDVFIRNNNEDNSNKRLKRLYESFDKLAEAEDETSSFDNKRKKVMEHFNQSRQINDDDFYDESNRRKKRKINSKFIEISSSDLDDSNNEDIATINTIDKNKNKNSDKNQLTTSDLNILTNNIKTINNDQLSISRLTSNPESLNNKNTKFNLINCLYILLLLHHLIIIIIFSFLSSTNYICIIIIIYI